MPVTPFRQRMNLNLGVLRASYEFANPAQHFEESMVTGTLAGELSALSDLTAGTNRFESFSEVDIQR